MTPNEDFVGNGEPHIEKFLCNGCNVAVRLADCSDEEVLFTSDQLLNRYHSIDVQNIRDEVTTFGNRSGTVKQHSERIA